MTALHELRDRHGTLSASCLVAGAVPGVAAAAYFQAQELLVLAVAGGGFVLLAVRRLLLALVVWIPVLFVEALPAANLAGKAGGLVLLAVWGVRCLVDPAPLRRVIAVVPAPVTTVLALLAWTSLSLAWAADWQLAAAALVRLLAVAVLLVLVVCAVEDVRDAQWVLAAVVVGGVLAVAVSLVVPPTEAMVASYDDSRRLGSAAGDPNYLGSWLLASCVLGLGLATAHRGRTRLAVLTACLVLAAGVLLTVSRGALLASLATVLLALALVRQHRVQMAQLSAVVVLATAAWLSWSAPAWERLTAKDGGTGRADLWQVARQVVREHWVAGVGPDNFVVVAPDAMRRTEPIQATYLLVRDPPDQVHSLYLQTLAEGGVVGLVLLLVFLATCLRATWRAVPLVAAAAPRFAVLPQAVLLAQVALLVTSAFLSSVVDKRLWLVLALGPALLVAARGAPTGPEPVESSA